MKFQASFIECEYTDSPNQHPDVISGDAEWDPPGGWEPFRMSLSSGKLLSLEDQVYG